MRWIKRLLIVFVSLAALGAAVLLAVVLLVDPNDYKGKISQMAKEETGRELKLEGDLKLAVFPSVAIEVRQASLGNPPGFGAEPFVAIGEARLVMRLWPLLRKHFEVKRVELSGLKVHLITDKSGKGNWENLGGEEQPKATSKSEPSTASATISSIEIRDCEVVMEDRRDGSTRRFMDLNVETGQIGSGRPVPVKLGFNLDSGEGSKATKIAFDSPGVGVNFDEETLDVPQFTLGFGDLDLSGSISGKKIVSARELAGALKLKETSLRGTLENFSGAPLKTRDPKAFTRVGFESKFALDANKFELIGFKGKLDDTVLGGSVGMALGEGGGIVFQLRADQLNIDRYRGPEEKLAPGEKPPPIELPLETLKKLNARGQLKIGRAEFSGMTLEDVTVNLTAADGDVRLGPTQAKLYGGSYRGTVSIDARGRDAKVTLDQHLQNIDFARLLAAAYDSKRFSGRGVANLAVTGHGRTSADIKRTLDGTMDFDVKDGALEGRDLWFELRRARALIKREAAPEGGDSGRTKFDVLKGTGKFVDGTLTTDDLAMQTQFLKVSGKGTVALPSDAVDLHINTKIYQVPPSGAGSEMSDLKTAADIPVRVTGTITDYKIRPDLQAAVKGEVKEKLKEKAREKLRELLGG
jgi:AsmA protein